MTDRFLNGPDANQTLADEKTSSGTVNWYFTDNQGTVRDVAQYNAGTNTTSVVDHLKFDSFGNITAQSNSASQPLFAYTGQMFDSNTGLYWYHARWYDPHTGRFISQDPSGFKAGDANLYRYVINDPANFVDPRGLSSDPSGGGQAAAEEQAVAAAQAQQYAGAMAAEEAAQHAAGQEYSGQMAAQQSFQFSPYDPGPVVAQILEFLKLLKQMLAGNKMKIGPDGSYSIFYATEEGGMIENRFTGDPIPGWQWFRSYGPDGTIIHYPLDGPYPWWTKERGGDWQPFVPPTPKDPPAEPDPSGFPIPQPPAEPWWEVELQNKKDPRGVPWGQEGNIYIGNGPLQGWLFGEHGPLVDEWKWGGGFRLRYGPNAPK